MSFTDDEFIWALRESTYDFERNMNQYRDKDYDFDFTSMSDDGMTYLRGGKEYKRPYGWKKYAIKCKGKYEDDDWLGTIGKNNIRTLSDNGEWWVAYHRTTEVGRSDKYGKGVYSSPDVEVVEDVDKIRIDKSAVLQIRVNPRGTRIVQDPAGTYYVTADPKDVRLYGVLVKEY